MPKSSEQKCGYGLPPAKNQFVKGRSGNPRGRPPRPSDVSSVLEKALNETVVIHERGKRRKITKKEAAFKQLANKAANGDARATKQVIDAVREDRRGGQGRDVNIDRLEVDDLAVVQGILERMRQALRTEASAGVEAP